MSATTEDRGQFQDRLDYLSDRLAIEDLLSTFTATMDGQDLARLAELFTPDAVVESPAGAFAGRDEVVAKVAEAVGGHFTSHHMISNVRVALAGDRARVVAYFHSVHLDDPEQPDQHEDHGGWYLLELARSEQGWRFRWLKQVSVWSAANRRPKGPLAPSVPEELSEFLAG